MRNWQGGGVAAPRSLTSHDYKIGERVEFFLAKGAPARRWVRATVIDVHHDVPEYGAVEVITQWGLGDASPAMTDESLDRPLVRKLATPERELREVYETEVKELVSRIHAICNEHDMPFLATFQVARGKDGDLVSSGNMHKHTTTPSLWYAGRVLHS